jgi:ACS family tartrate transporter-like MFS transporter
MIGWVKDQTGSFTGGLYFVAGLLILSTVLTLILSFTQKNKVSAAELTNP